MKTKQLLILFLIAGLFAFAPQYSQAQTIGKPDGNTLNFFTTNSTGRLLGHREAGSFGSFVSSAQWIGIGQPVTFPGSTTKVPAYGLRSQWSGQTGIFSLKGSGSVKDLAIEWGNNVNSKLRFSFISDLNNPSALTEVMTMTSSGRVGIGQPNPGATLDVNTDLNVAASTFGFRNALSGSTFGITGTYTVMTSISGFGSAATVSSVEGSSDIMYGGFFDVDNSSTSGTTYGVFARADGANAPDTWAGYFEGDVFVSGSFTSASDRKFKEDINELPRKEMISKIMKLQPSSYYYKQDKQVKFGNGLQYGFVAQDVEKVFPDLVKNVKQPVLKKPGADGNSIFDDSELVEFKSVNYIGMIPILTKALQEHETEMDTYRAEIADLKAKNQELVAKFSQLLKAIENNDSGLLKDIVETSETSLGQNQPNPFGQSTEIIYSLASSVQKANIQIYNMDGKLLGDYPLVKDQKSLKLNANTFEPGVYVYVMIADGKTIGTRRMIISE